MPFLTQPSYFIQDLRVKTAHSQQMEDKQMSGRKVIEPATFRSVDKSRNSWATAAKTLSQNGLIKPILIYKREKWRK